MIHRRCRYALAGSVMLVLVAAVSLRAHDAHMLIGRSATGQLKCHPSDGIQDNALTVLALIPPGGPIEGYSASIPGFSLVLAPSAEDDCYPLEEGADVWLELVWVDAPLLIVETPSYRIINEQTPPEARIGGEPTSHMHPLWLLDTTDPSFNPATCAWEALFILKDAGSTGYADSEVLTFRFAAGSAPCPADFDCDRDVDADDLELFEQCATGPGVLYDPLELAEACALSPDDEGILPADLDRDGDVDQVDVGLFQGCQSGSGQAGDPDCLVRE